MQENEFEKQVGQKMDGFRLRPSDPVWLGINAELNRKKRRRLLFIPLFAILLVAGYFAWQQWTTPANNAVTSSGYKNPVHTNPTEENVPVEIKDKEETTTDLKTKEKQPVQHLQPDEKEPKVKQPKVKQQDVTLHGKNSTDYKKKAGKGDKQLFSAKQRVEKSPLQNQKEIEHSGKEDRIAIQINRSKKYPSNKKGLFSVDGNAETNIPEQQKYQFTTHDNTVELNQPSIYLDKNPVPVNYAQAKMTEPTNTITENKMPELQLPSLKMKKTFGTDRNLKVGFAVSSGISSRHQSILSLYSAADEEKSLNASAPYSLNSGNNAGRGVLILQPSAVKPGFAFKAGILAMKPLSKRFDASVGLQYSYSSDRIEIGNSINNYIAQGQSFFDIQAAAFNAGTKKVNYTNKYHFIELPVSLHFNVTPKWKAPFVWNGGVSVSRLVSSNVLLYDAALGGVYYQGSKDLNKTQLSLSTGFSFRFSTQNRLQWNIGPEIYMNTSKLFNNIYDKNNHAVYGGLNMQLLFSPKKKNRLTVF